MRELTGTWCRQDGLYYFCGDALLQPVYVNSVSFDFELCHGRIGHASKRVEVTSSFFVVIRVVYIRFVKFLFVQNIIEISFLPTTIKLVEFFRKYIVIYWVVTYMFLLVVHIIFSL